MPTKRLPRTTTLDDLQGEAIAHAPLSEGDGQLTIARESGFQSWMRLRDFVDRVAASGDEPTSSYPLDIPHHERIEQPLFRRAVDWLDQGAHSRLDELLGSHPALCFTRVLFEGENYFQEPALLEFIAENPIRQGKLAANAQPIAELIISHMLRAKQANRCRFDAIMQSTLGLVSTGRIAREHGLQIPLIQTLCAHGTDPEDALSDALAHGEFDAAHELLLLGATPTLNVAAALDQLDRARALLENTDSVEQYAALALAAQNGRACIISLLLTHTRIDPNRYNPQGYHSHSTPLHQAALGGHLEAVEALIEHGAKPDIKDVHYGATAADWAEHGGQVELARKLRAIAI